MRDEDAWLERLRQGDPDALRWLYETYRNDLLRVAASLLGDLNEVEDCLHDVIVAVVAMADRLQVRTSIKAYLITCMVNQVRSHLQRRQRAIEASAVPGEPLEIQSADGLKITIRREDE